MMTKDGHDKILDIVLRDYRGNLPAREKTMLSKQKQFRSIYKWLKKYTVVTAGDRATLVFRRDLKSEDTDIPSALEEYQVISHVDRVFDDILRFHKGDHPKGRTLSSRVKEKYGKSIPEWVCRLFTDTCPICVGCRNRKKPTAGHRPILTNGFGARGQIDCIDFQSMPDGGFVYLLNYQDHGIKFVFSIPMTSKRATAVAWALLEIFTVIGPPLILQSDIGREFSGAASNMPGSRVAFADKDIDEIIVEIKKLWPECRMVKGSPGHSQSNRGIERMNCTVQRKLGAWMDKKGSKRWSIGCKLVQWRINTQVNITIGNETSYKLAFGQRPRVGLSALPLHTDLNNSIATEGHLNRVLGLSEDDKVENSVIMTLPSQDNVLVAGTQEIKETAVPACDDNQKVDTLAMERITPVEGMTKYLSADDEIIVPFEGGSEDGLKIDARPVLSVKEAFQNFQLRHVKPTLMDKFHDLCCNISCSTCRELLCTDIETVDVAERCFYEQMASGCDWALMIPDDVQSIVSIVHSQSHYAALHFDLDQKLVNVYDGIQLPKQTWDCHIDQIVTQIEKMKITIIANGM